MGQVIKKGSRIGKPLLFLRSYAVSSKIINLLHAAATVALRANVLDIGDVSIAEHARQKQAMRAGFVPTGGDQ